jgi:phosphoenolpyruvate carboxykinase (ATP)
MDSTRATTLAESDDDSATLAPAGTGQPAGQSGPGAVVNRLLSAHRGKVHANLSVPELIEEAVRRGEGHLAANGALAVGTGKYTGRSPEDRYIDGDSLTGNEVDWGKVNKPFEPERFDRLYARVMAYLEDRDLFVCDGFAGADPKYRIPVRIISELAWHALFARQLFIHDEGGVTPSEPPLTVIDAGRFGAIPEIDGTRSETFIILDFKRRTVLIGGTEYAGEIKKSVFSVMNYLLPHRHVLPMHCSANVGADGGVALFFGLSGTGKTTLSADPDRRLIGDDEHGWGDDGVFNFEGGCYAKCVHLTEATEPQIWSAIRYGAVLENVVLDPHSRAPSYDDTSLTENTRAAYPLSFIPGAVIPSVAGPPSTILFLAADAFGVLPPVARLTPAQAMYHFLSGYTSKLAGTERGVTTPQATFSACFGAPFMPLAPAAYASLLGERLERHGTQCYLVNTGWTGGAFGVGKRLDLGVTRAIVAAAISGALADAPGTPDPVFGFVVPSECPGVPSALLDPRSTWLDPVAYDRARRALAGLFAANFARFADAAEEVKAAGPVM